MRLDIRGPLNDACFELTPITSNFDPLRDVSRVAILQGSEAADLILANPVCCHRDQGQRTKP